MIHVVLWDGNHSQWSVSELLPFDGSFANSAVED